MVSEHWYRLCDDILEYIDTTFGENNYNILGIENEKIHMLCSHFAFTIVAAAKVRSETGIVIQGYLGDSTFKILKLKFLKVRQASIIN